MLLIVPKSLNLTYPELGTLLWYMGYKQNKVKIDVVNIVHMLARDVFDVAKRQFQNMQKNFT